MLYITEGKCVIHHICLAFTSEDWFFAKSSCDISLKLLDIEQNIWSMSAYVLFNETQEWLFQCILYYLYLKWKKATIKLCWHRGKSKLMKKQWQQNDVKQWAKECLHTWSASWKVLQDFLSLPSPTGMSLAVQQCAKISSELFFLFKYYQGYFKWTLGTSA